MPAVGPGQTPRLELHLLESPKALKKKDKVTQLKDNPKDTRGGGTGADEEFLGLVSSSNDVFTNLLVSKHTLTHSTASRIGLGGSTWSEREFSTVFAQLQSRGVAKSLIRTKSVTLSSSSRRSESKDITRFSRVFQFNLTWTPFPEFF